MLLKHLTTNIGRLSDFIRFLMLFLYGGAYSDMDCFPILGLEKWPHYPFENTGIIFSMEGTFAEQYFIITQPRHPLVG
jgi:mannosyltransferase OCH1-like enzyme